MARAIREITIAHLDQMCALRAIAMASRPGARATSNRSRYRSAHSLFSASGASHSPYSPRSKASLTASSPFLSSPSLKSCLSFLVSAISVPPLFLTPPTPPPPFAALRDTIETQSAYARFWQRLGHALPLGTPVQEWRYAHIRLPGPHREPDPPDPGINLARSFTVSVTFRTPDVTQDDLGTLRDAVRHAWQRAGGLDPSDRHRLTDAGRALLRAWREAGGPEGRGGRSFWEEVRQGWQALAAADERIPAPPSKVESVRRYWYLLEKKRESGLLNHIPSTTPNSDPGEKR